MDNETLTRIFSPRSADYDQNEQSANEALADFACYGTAAPGTVVMLNLKNNCPLWEIGINYGYLAHCFLSPPDPEGTQCIELNFSGAPQIRIHGAALAPIFHGMLSRSVSWVKPNPEARLPDGSTRISKIEKR